MDKVAIEEIVMEILRRQDAGARGEDTKIVAQERTKFKPDPVEQTVKEMEPYASGKMDESMFALIADTMSAFRGQ